MAVILYIPTIVLEKEYPNRFALVFAGFAILLIGYLALKTQGPSDATPEGRMIQVVGQKVVAYASVISVVIQALGARHVLRSRSNSEAT